MTVEILPEQEILGRVEDFLPNFSNDCFVAAFGKHFSSWDALLWQVQINEP